MKSLKGSTKPGQLHFAVSVMIATYHVFSEWLSLIVKTRSSQAVKKLLDLQPETARVDAILSVGRPVGDAAPPAGRTELA